MGTRADFYAGKNESAEWLGSIAWDGYREGIPETILTAPTEDIFRCAIEEFLKRGDATLPAMGWPWPWDSSRTTDCSYWFFDGQVWDEHDGRYCRCREEIPENLDDRERIVFPDMTRNKKVAFGPRSGLIVFGL